MNTLRFTVPWLLTLILSLMSFSAFSGQVERIRFSHTEDKTRVVLDLSSKPSYSATRLINPERLVLDLKNTKLTADLKATENASPLLKRIRVSSPQGRGELRLVLDLLQSAGHKLQVLGKSPEGFYRLVIDLQPSSGDPIVGSASPGRNVVIAIDPGHGGKDPGSIGPAGTYEKNVVLPISLKLKEMIDAMPGFEASMVRNGDYFVTLDNRSAKAREKRADLLVSVHADAFSSPQPRGASVWILSLRRSDSEMGRWLERDDKLSELRGVGEVMSQVGSDDPHLQRTFLDLARDNSMAESQELASSMLAQMKKVTQLHKAEPQAASLAVLKSPDFPSLLVETGFISNPEEEKLLKTSSHQTKLANALAQAIKAHFHDKPPRDSLLAQKQAIQIHKVVRGESLSLIAKRYNVTVAALKQANAIKSDILHVGAELVIPAS